MACILINNLYFYSLFPIDLLNWELSVWLVIRTCVLFYDTCAPICILIHPCAHNVQHLTTDSHQSPEHVIRTSWLLIIQVSGVAVTMHLILGVVSRTWLPAVSETSVPALCQYKAFLLLLVLPCLVPDLCVHYIFFSILSSKSIFNRAVRRLFSPLSSSLAAVPNLGKQTKG